MMPAIRVLRHEDAEEISQLLRVNRTFLEPWDPVRDESYFTAETQAHLLHEVLEAHADGTAHALVILDRSGAIAGRLNLNGITRGAFQSATMAYWVSEDRNGQGLATAGVGEAARIAFDDLGLHRLQAETLVHNQPSQRVLARNGFHPYGKAPGYLKIAGRWQDHILYQMLADEHDP